MFTQHVSLSRSGSHTWEAHSVAPTPGLGSKPGRHAVRELQVAFLSTSELDGDITEALGTCELPVSALTVIDDGDVNGSCAGDGAGLSTVVLGDRPPSVDRDVSDIADEGDARCSRVGEGLQIVALGDVSFHTDGAGPGTTWGEGEPFALSCKVDEGDAC